MTGQTNRQSFVRKKKKTKYDIIANCNYLYNNSVIMCSCTVFQRKLKCFNQFQVQQNSNPHYLYSLKLFCFRLQFPYYDYFKEFRKQFALTFT